ncbi:YbdD/YjiX family protein [Candidatus Arsenophonus nilaparvatae]|uniref:YbdD/YjiX family protein n=1 Tax=Candidatus Arsenophonus nilaparvatae TaxID=1247023 RepID=UPI000509AF19|nr:YbdD/YjiX family protein [Candidatus Arsenophonus nilaparvatae]
MFNNLGQVGKYLGQAALMLIGIPDYDNYVQHMRNTHPEQSIMSYEEFFRQRQAARYASSDNGGFRCC